MKYTTKEKSRDKNEVNYEVNVDYSELKPFQEEAYKELSKDVKISGFRPGKAPRNVIEEKLGVKIISEALGKLMPKIAYEIIVENEDKPVETPHYHLEKVDEKEGITFSFHFVNYPEVKLGDFSKIKVKKEMSEVGEAEIEEVIKSIIRSSVSPEKIKELTKITEEKPKKTDKKAKSDDKDEEGAAIKDFELNEALVKELGYKDEQTLESLRKAVKERLVGMKEEQSENEYTQKVVQEAIKLSKFEIPDVFIEREVQAQENQFNARLTELKLESDVYLSSQGTSIEEKRKEWEKQAKDKIAIDLVLITLANEHDDVALDSDIDEEIEKIQDPKVREQYKSDSAREYVRSVLTRQKGLRILFEIVEGKKKTK